MTAYIVAHLHSVKPGKDLAEYLRRVDVTLEQFGGHFLVHGGYQRVLEGPAQSQVVVVEFPDATAARRWYESTSYQAIAELRTRNSVSTLVMAEKCLDGHRAVDMLTADREPTGIEPGPAQPPESTPCPVSTRPDHI